MRTLIILSVAICIGLLSCTKENAPSPKSVSVPLTLVGSWHVVSDTSHSVWIATASNPTGNYVSVYTGKESDHYNFSSSGIFDLNEASAVSSGTYSLKDSALTLNYVNSSWQESSTYQLVKLTDHSAVLVAGSASPGGPSWHVITLAK